MYMGRMSRWDWLELVAPVMKPRKRKSKTVRRPKAELKKYTTRVNGKRYTFSAYTKSEARSQLKAQLGGVIPVGTIFVEKP